MHTCLVGYISCKLAPGKLGFPPFQFDWHDPDFLFFLINKLHPLWYWWPWCFYGGISFLVLLAWPKMVVPPHWMACWGLFQECSAIADITATICMSTCTCGHTEIDNNIFLSHSMNKNTLTHVQESEFLWQCISAIMWVCCRCVHVYSSTVPRKV